MTVTFQVGDREFGGAGNLEIDFWVGAPLSRALGEAETTSNMRGHFEALWALSYRDVTYPCAAVSRALSKQPILTRFSIS